MRDGHFLVQRLLDNGENSDEMDTIDSAVFFREFRVQAAFDTAHGADTAGGRASLARGPQTASGAGARGRGPAAGKEAVTDKDIQDMLYGGGALGGPALRGDKKASLDRFGVGDDGKGGGVQTGGRTFFRSGAPAAGAGEGLEERPAAANLHKVEKQLRSDFSIAMIRLRSNRALALESLKKILEHRAPFEKEHKHMFSDFGTALRRSHLYAMSCGFHEKAKTLAPDDEHILFNLARALYDSGKVAQARDCLRQALDMDGAFKMGSAFLEFIERRGKEGSGG
jgi:hypothetical protein